LSWGGKSPPAVNLVCQVGLPKPWVSGLGEWIATRQSLPHPLRIRLLVALDHGFRVLPPAEGH
ncbi:MAG: hypothetical protein ACE10G_03020, partial [Gemmatimonadales bacterium]